MQILDLGSPQVKGQVQTSSISIEKYKTVQNQPENKNS